jgi:hypothetical protein
MNSCPVGELELEEFSVRAVPVNRNDFPAVVVILNSVPDVVLLRMMVWSVPVVEAPPVVAETAPAPWIVTDLLNVTFICCEPVQVQLPAGIEIMSPSAAAACSAVIAA